MPIRLAISDEYSRLTHIAVNDAGALVGPDEAAHLHAKHGAHIEAERADHPEDAPWDAQRVRAQHAEFLRTLEQEGVQLWHAPSVPEAIYGVFTRDIAFVIGSTFFHARPGDGVRRLEREGIAPLTDTLHDVVDLKRGNIEGGDVLVDGDRVWVGQTRFSTDTEGLNGLREALAPAGVEVVPVPLAQGVLHLDCRMALLPHGRALLYDGDMDEEAAQRIRKTYEVIDVTRDELTALGPNVLSISPEKIVVDARNKRLDRALRAEGFDTIPVVYDEVTKLWGAFRCTTLPLRRA